MTHKAIAHFKRTGVIIPGEQDRIAEYLAQKEDEENDE